MSSELNILALYGLYTALIVILKVTGATGQLGMGYLHVRRGMNSAR